MSLTTTSRISAALKAARLAAAQAAHVADRALAARGGK